jgi:hypothetical protein
MPERGLVAGRRNFLQGHDLVSRAWLAGLSLVFVLFTAQAHADGVLSPCSGCQVLVGAGTTFRYFGWTQGLVIPISFQFGDGHWEIDATRFATAQTFDEPYVPASIHSANPYWGFTVVHRWELLHWSWSRFYAGVGANYRTETDYLVNSKWNFAFVLAERFELPHGVLLELALNHWSDAWIRQPDRGQNLLTLSVSF